MHFVSLALVLSCASAGLADKQPDVSTESGKHYNYIRRIAETSDIERLRTVLKGYYLPAIRKEDQGAYLKMWAVSDTSIWNQGKEGECFIPARDIFGYAPGEPECDSGDIEEIMRQKFVAAYEQACGGVDTWNISPPKNLDGEPSTPEPTPGEKSGEKPAGPTSRSSENKQAKRADESSTSRKLFSPE